MKHALLLLLSVAISTLSFAQEKPQKRFQFELGLNSSHPLGKLTTPRPKVLFYLNGTYRLPEKPLSIKLKISFDKYTYSTPFVFYPGIGLIMTKTEVRSLTIIPSLNYHWRLHRHVALYTGMGTGVSFGNHDAGVFNAGFKTRLNVAPQVGIELFRHLNVSAQCVLTNNTSSRLMLHLGYMF